MTADRNLQDPSTSHTLRTGYPPQITYPEREDVQEVSQEDYDKIIENRINKLTG